MEVVNALGRRKRAIARVFVSEGTGKITINKRDLAEYFPSTILQYVVKQPLNKLGAAEKYDIKVNLCGGGFTGQSQALRLAIARALVKMNAEDKAALRAEQCLSFPMGVLLSDKKEYLLNLKIKNATVFLIIFSFIGVTCLLIKQLPIIREYFDTYLYYFIELGIKLPLGLSMILFLWILPSKYVISPFVTLCGVLSYELYLVHMQMLSNVGTYVTSALMIILLSLLISYSMHFAILFFTKNVR